jgi:hypothetical protein
MKHRFLALAVTSSAILFGVSTANSQSFRIPLRIGTNSGASDSLWFGIDTVATFCIDPALGEEPLPPIPPSFTFDARFINPRSGQPLCFDEGTKKDIRPFVSTTQVDTYKVRMQAGDNGLPVRFSWPDLSTFYTNAVWLRVPINGSMLNINMKTDTAAVTTLEGSFYIITGDPAALPPAPTTTTGLPTFVSGTSARLNGSANPNGTSTTGWFEWGTTTSYGNTTSAQSLGSGTTSAQLFAQISGLSTGSTYHFRCVAQNMNGTSYGNDGSFVAAPDSASQTMFPIHVTDNHTDIITLHLGVHNSATFCLDPALGEIALPPSPPSGTLDARLINPRPGGVPECFDQGTRLDLRSYLGTAQVDTFRLSYQSGVGDSLVFSWPDLDVFFNDPVTLVDPYGGLAINLNMRTGSSCTLTGNTFVPALLVISGVPAPEPPRPGVMTQPATNVSLSSAQLEGIANPNGSSTTAWFQWGTTSAYGNTTPVAFIGGGLGIIPVDHTVSGLSPSTTYHYRVVAQNGNGVMEGPDRVFTTSAEATNIYGFIAGWNMVSLPMSVSDGRTTAQFPTAISQAFAFANSIGYTPADSLTSGVGYWLKFGTTQDVPITGIPIAEDTIEIGAGWNIIGSITNPVATGDIVQIPSGILQSPFFEFDGLYAVASTLLPSKAFWVKSALPGKLVLSSGRAGAVQKPGP